MLADTQAKDIYRSLLMFVCSADQLTNSFPT